jgi:fatty-acyl-CoA synthase
MEEILARSRLRLDRPDAGQVGGVGETGMAIMAVRPGYTLSEAEIHAHYERVSRAQRPRPIRFVDALPHNATGEIHKPTLRPQFGSPEAAGTTQAAGW